MKRSSIRPIRQLGQLLAMSLALAAGPASAAKLKLPYGMGGVPDIGAIPCSVFSEMLVVGPKGTRLSLLTWAGGYIAASSGLSLQQAVDAAEQAGKTWDYTSLTGHLVDYCAANPEAMTRQAVIDLGKQLNAPAP